MRLLLLFSLALALLTTTAPTSNLPICNSAVHDRYASIGPDGVKYASWHQQIDSYYGCRFDHEHGSDPALVLPGYKPMYGYSARGMPEGHNGFKGYAFNAAGYRWYITQHQGTSKADVAACNRYHTLDILAVDGGGQTGADLHLMADFGAARNNETNAILTTACSQPTSGTTGLRQFPIADSRNIGYEPWRADAPNNILGLRLKNITFNTINPVSACDTISCTTSVKRDDPNVGPALGTYRNLTVYAGFGIVASGVYSGTFSTDMHGTGAGDTQQYIKPGLNVVNPVTIELYPYGQSYIYAPLTPGYDSMVFRMNPLITGAN